MATRTVPRWARARVDNPDVLTPEGLVAHIYATYCEPHADGLDQTCRFVARMTAMHWRDTLTLDQWTEQVRAGWPGMRTLGAVAAWLDVWTDANWDKPISAPMRVQARMSLKHLVRAYFDVP